MLKIELEKLVEDQAEEIEMLKKANEGLTFELAGWKGLQEFDAGEVTCTSTTLELTPEMKLPAMDRR